MSRADAIAQGYVDLARNIDLRSPGFLDVWPDPSRPDVEPAEPPSLEALQAEADRLLEAARSSTDLDAGRRRFLSRQLDAMRALTALLAGGSLPLVEEVEALYDVTPRWVDEGDFDEAHRILDDLLPAGPSLERRLSRHREATRLDFDAFETVLDLTAREFRSRARALLPLPDGDAYEIHRVRDQPWPAYHYYLGEGRSRVEINLDAPLSAASAVYFATHEIYPGHHTELSIKDRLLLRRQGRREHGVWPINTPMTTVSEGIAERAARMLLPGEEWTDWHSEVVYPAAGLAHLDAERRHRVSQAVKRLDGVYNNAVFLLHERGLSEADVVAYFQRQGLASQREAEQRVEMMTSPQLRAYYFTYIYGGALLDELAAARPLEDFLGRLYTEPVTPGEIREWIAGPPADRAAVDRREPAVPGSDQSSQIA